MSSFSLILKGLLLIWWRGMFCSQCGTKIKENDKFCSKCGHPIAGPASPDNKGKNSIPVAPAPSRNSGCLSCFSILLIFLSISFLASSISYYSAHKGDEAVKVVIAASLFFFVFFILGIWGLVRASHKNHPAQMQVKTPENTASQAEGKKPAQNILAVLAIIIVFGVTFYVFGTWITPVIKDAATSTATPYKGSTSETTSKSWDGYYPTTMTKPNCDSSVELTAFVVSGNAVQNPWGSNVKIGSTGKVTMTYNAGSTPTIANATFTSSGVSGTWSSGHCSGTFKGTRR